MPSFSLVEFLEDSGAMLSGATFYAGLISLVSVTVLVLIKFSGQCKTLSFVLNTSHSLIRR